MTSKAILLVTRILQNRDLLECTGMAHFGLDEDGHVEYIHLPGYKIRRYEKSDQRHGVIFKFEFFEGNKPFFTVMDYMRGGVQQVSYLKKEERFREKKMDQIVYSIDDMVNNTINSLNHVAKYLAGAL